MEAGGRGDIILDPGDEGSGTFTPTGDYYYTLDRVGYVWVETKPAYDEVVPAGIIPMAWARAIEILLGAKEATPIVSELI